VPIARLNRDALRALADSKLEEARVLLDNKLWTGAYSAVGLAVECALKSVLASAVKEYDFPDKRFVSSMHQHNLENLLQLDAALWAALQADIMKDAKLRVNWSTVKDWDIERRYDIVEELEAKGVYEATTEAASGVMDWIKGRW
jgi:HEPN domain-containing protein